MVQTLLILCLVFPSLAMSQDQLPVRLGPVSVVATAAPGFRIFPGVSVSPREGGGHVYADEGLTETPLEPLFREAIFSSLVARGYRLAPPGESTYEVAFVLAMADAMSDDQLVAELGFSPGLPSADDDRFARGTLAVMLMQPDSNQVVWRGAIQAFADLEADPERRAQRIALATQRLLRALPEPPQ